MKANEISSNETTFSFKGQELILDTLKSLYWVEERMLVVSDIHLGKAAHFRKNGVPVPKSIHTSDLVNLDILIRKYQPEKVVFLGDLFHSVQNLEWMDFIEWSQKYKAIQQILVQGNHDVLNQEAYNQTRVEVISELIKPPFHFSHEPSETQGYNIAGHIHPGIRLYGKARQVMVLSCFFFASNQAILPAFGNFTGKYVLSPSKGDHVFAIAEDSIIALMS